MFESLPIISKKDLDSMGEDVGVIGTKTFQIMLGLDRTNPELAAAIQVYSESASTAVTRDAELQTDIQAKCIAAILCTLRLVELALENRRQKIS